MRTFVFIIWALFIVGQHGLWAQKAYLDGSEKIHTHPRLLMFK